MGIYCPCPEHTLSFRQGVPLFLGRFLLHRHTAAVCEQSQGCGLHWHVADAWMPLAQQNLCILLLACGVAPNHRDSEIIWAQPVWSW